MSKEENAVLAASLCTKFQGISDETVMIKYTLVAIWYLWLAIFVIKTKYHTASIDFNHTVCNSFMLIKVISILSIMETRLFCTTNKNYKNSAAHGDDRCLK